MPGTPSFRKRESSKTGRYIITSVAGKAVKAYIPAPLPPDPPLDMRKLHGRIERADRAVGRLDGLSSIVPDANLLLYSYVRKEAVLSSQIEAHSHPFPNYCSLKTVQCQACRSTTSKKCQTT